MTRLPPPGPTVDASAEEVDEVEVVDALPVLAEPSPATAPVRTSGQVVAQAAAVAATGFVAGAATAAVVRHVRTRRGGTLGSPRRTGKRVKGLGEVVATQSLLIDVHVLATRD